MASIRPPGSDLRAAYPGPPGGAPLRPHRAPPHHFPDRIDFTPSLPVRVIVQLFTGTLLCINTILDYLSNFWREYIKPCLSCLFCCEEENPQSDDEGEDLMAIAQQRLERERERFRPEPFEIKFARMDLRVAAPSAPPPGRERREGEPEQLGAAVDQEEQEMARALEQSQEAWAIERAWREAPQPAEKPREQPQDLKEPALPTSQSAPIAPRRAEAPKKELPPALAATLEIVRSGFKEVEQVQPDGTKVEVEMFRTSAELVEKVYQPLYDAIQKTPAFACNKVDLLLLTEIPDALANDPVLKCFLCSIDLTPIRFIVNDPTIKESAKTVIPKYERTTLEAWVEQSGESPITREKCSVDQIKPSKSQALIDKQLKFHSHILNQLIQLGQVQ